MAIRLSRTFVLRKLHQLTGIMPLGFFLLEHFYTNSKALTGPTDFNNAVRDLQSIPYILFVEIGGIFIPLIYHAVYGMLITAEARPNNLNYPYPRNWFYTVQRLTGIILFFFITFHVLNFRFGLIPHLFLVDWGITIGERAQRLTGYACIAFGVLLLAVGINAAVAFIRPGGLLGGIL